MITKEQIKEIMKEVEYEWDEKSEKFLQEQLIHWADCYDEIGYNQTNIMMPLNVSSYCWRDLFTNVVETIQDKVEKKIVVLTGVDKNG